MNSVPWPHAPTHQLSAAGTYLVTAGTYLKAHHFRGRERLEVLQRGLLKVLGEAGWQVEAWAIFSNHYHFVAHCPRAEAAPELSRVLGDLHAKTAGWVNRLEGAPGRKVWHNFWETRLTYQRSYLARLNYVHQNPVRHNLVLVANQYPWCSAGWFERTLPTSRVKSVYRFKVDNIAVLDDYEVASEW
jgi:putative transposase